MSYFIKNTEQVKIASTVAFQALTMKSLVYILC